MSLLGVRNIENYNQRIIEAINKSEKIVRSIPSGISPDTGQPTTKEIEIENKNGADPVTNELKPEDLDLILKMTDPDTSKRLTIEGSLSEWDTVHPPRAERAAAGVFGD